MSRRCSTAVGRFGAPYLLVGHTRRTVVVGSTGPVGAGILPRWRWRCRYSYRCRT